MHFLLLLSIITIFLSHGTISTSPFSTPKLPPTDGDLSTSGKGDKKSSAERTNTGNGDIPSPKDFNNDIDKFIYDQTRSGQIGVNLIPMGTDQDPTTALEYEFLGQAWNMGVNDLKGCTLVTVISENLDRLWAAHLYEVPGFTNGDQFFQDKIITPILQGNLDPEVHVPSLLKNKERFGKKPVTLIISTRRWLSKIEYDFKFKHQLDTLQTHLRGLWPDMPPTITVDYEKQIEDSAYDRTASGKFLIQYGPGLANGLR